jgi:hypothetical protein
MPPSKDLFFFTRLKSLEASGILQGMGYVTIKIKLILDRSIYTTEIRETLPKSCKVVVYISLVVLLIKISGVQQDVLV